MSPVFECRRREAKRLLRDLRCGNAATAARYAQYWPGADAQPTLARAQLVIAREQGYRSWAHLKSLLLPGATMKEQKSASRRLGVYTYEEAESLLDVPAATIRELAERFEKKVPRYLDVILLEKIWVTAKPFIVTLKRNDGKPVTREDGRLVQEAVLQAGGMLAMHMAQWRFATLAEAERAAAQQAPVAGYTWIVMALGLDETLKHLKTVWRDLAEQG